MQYGKGSLVVFICTLLAACGGGVRHGEPAPVVSSGNSAGSTVNTGRSGSSTGGEPQVQAYQPPQQVAVARPQPARAVQVLMRRAEDQRSAGDYAAAAASLERGLRIEPRNARLWNRLAHVRSEQGQVQRVEQFAAKSNALAGNDDGLRADNWQLIAEARATQGDKRGAARAREQARVSR